MKKMVISIIVEGKEEDINSIKGAIIRTASDALVSVHASEVPETKHIDTSMFDKINRR